MSLFDGLQNALFETVKTVMGDSAIWTKSGSPGETFTAIVLLKAPSDKRKVWEPEFDPLSPVVEWKKGDLPGLFELVRNGSEETIMINGQAYGILQAKAKYDGNTYIAEVQII